MSGATLPVLYSYNMAALVAAAGFRVKLDSTTARVFEVTQATDSGVRVPGGGSVVQARKNERSTRGRGREIPAR